MMLITCYRISPDLNATRYPHEKEILFPPLAFLKPTGRAEVVEGYTFVEVAPTVA